MSNPRTLDKGEAVMVAAIIAHEANGSLRFVKRAGRMQFDIIAEKRRLALRLDPGVDLNGNTDSPYKFPYDADDIFGASTLDDIAAAREVEFTKWGDPFFGLKGKARKAAKAAMAAAKS